MANGNIRGILPWNEQVEITIMVRNWGHSTEMNVIDIVISFTNEKGIHFEWGDLAITWNRRQRTIVIGFENSIYSIHFMDFMDFGLRKITLH